MKTDNTIFKEPEDNTGPVNPFLDPKAGSYSGAEWLMGSYSDLFASRPISEIGIIAANFLGELFGGIYHVSDMTDLRRIVWDNPNYIAVRLRCTNFATFDGDRLTRLVFLAHHAAVRVEMNAVDRGVMEIVFHRRKRGGRLMERHPTLTAAVAGFQNNVSIAEAG